MFRNFSIASIMTWWVLLLSKHHCKTRYWGEFPHTINSKFVWVPGKFLWVLDVAFSCHKETTLCPKNHQRQQQQKHNNHHYHRRRRPRHRNPHHHYHHHQQHLLLLHLLLLSIIIISSSSSSIFIISSTIIELNFIINITITIIIAIIAILFIIIKLSRLSWYLTFSVRSSHRHRHHLCTAATSHRDTTVCAVIATHVSRNVGQPMLNTWWIWRQIRLNILVLTQELEWLLFVGSTAFSSYHHYQWLGAICPAIIQESGRYWARVY